MLFIKKCFTNFPWCCYFIFQRFFQGILSLFHPRSETSFQSKTNYLPLYRILPFPLEPHMRCSMDISPVSHTWANREKLLPENCWLPPRRKKTEEVLRQRIVDFRQWEWVTEKIAGSTAYGQESAGCGCGWHAALFVVFQYYREKRGGIFLLPLYFFLLTYPLFKVTQISLTVFENDCLKKPSLFYFQYFNSS